MPTTSAVQDFFEHSARKATDQGLQKKLENASQRHLESVTRAKAQFLDYEDERSAARRIKEETVANLRSLLDQLVERLQSKGFKVYRAPDAAAARQYIMNVVRASDARLIVKGKSMATEEIGLNHYLETAGLQVVETDLGEYIVQLRGERPSHIITPAIHLSKEDIGQSFAERLGVPYSSDPSELTAIARHMLRDKFLRADLGIIGVNFAVAETGTLVSVENEGNSRLSATLPKTVVAVMGMEKLVPRFADLSHFLEILARTATGQKLSAYTSLINSVTGAEDGEGPREFHVVILDNGRQAMVEDPVLREALYCLRCGACLNVCPIYRHIGGHAYDSAYPGPIGSIVSPPLFGFGRAGHLAFASTLCGACKDICPVKIDIPKILLHLRWKASQPVSSIPWPRSARLVREGAKRFVRLARWPAMARMGAAIARRVLRLSGGKSYVRWLPAPFDAWTRYRDLPVTMRDIQATTPTHKGPSR